MFNYYGLIFFILLMIPNIIYTIKNKNGFQNKFDIKLLEYSEQIGRIGTFIFFIFNIPYTFYGFWFHNALTVYIIINGMLVLGYIVSWIIMWKKNNLTKALLLSILPSLMFVFSGIMYISIPLIVFSIIFGFTHIAISVINATK